VFLDLNPGMTATSTAVAPDPGQTRMNTPVPQCEISTPAAEILPRRALVVDDEPLIRWAISETLKGLGFDVHQASDAASALRELLSGPAGFDVILLDLRLPDMRDLSLLGTLRQLQPGGLRDSDDGVWQRRSRGARHCAGRAHRAV
jgi:CheY-like chemotaxis protein